MPSERRCGSPSMRYSGEGWTIAITGPAPCSLGATVVMTWGWLGAPGQKGQCPSAWRRCSSSPTITQERVIGSLRSSISLLGKHLSGGSVNKGHLPNGFSALSSRLFSPLSCAFSIPFYISVVINFGFPLSAILAILAILAIPLLGSGFTITRLPNSRITRFPLSEPSTPLMRQYAAIKKQHPTALLFFRLGDFYELFFEDAVVASRELQITLTSRNKEKDVAIPMCGVPYHAAEGYLSKLLRKGYKVAICEQMEDPKVAKKLVRREVTRVLTPRTAADASLSASENNFLAALARHNDACGLAVLDLSTGDFRATEFTGSNALGRVLEELQQLRPRELLYPSTLPLFDRVDDAEPSATLEARNLKLEMALTETPLEDWAFAPDYAIPLVENQFGVLSLEGYGLAGRTE